MHYTFSVAPFLVFLAFVGVVLAISFYFGSKAKSASGYYAAHGQINWFVNGVAFAGDYLSAASFLGICGMIAFFGYDGFLYSIGYLAGWVVALFVIAEPLKKLGKFTFADALDKKFNSRGIKLTAAISTLLVSLFYLIPQMVGAGALIKPLLGLPEYAGVIIVGVVVIMIVVTAGMVSTTYVQFIKGSLLVIFCVVLTGMILRRGLNTDPSFVGPYHGYAERTLAEVAATGTVVAPIDGWSNAKSYVRVKHGDGSIVTWKFTGADKTKLVETQTITEKTPDKVNRVNGLPQGNEAGQADFFPVGQVRKLPDSQASSGPLGPMQFISTLQKSDIVVWRAEADKIKGADGSETTIYAPKVVTGSSLLTAGATPTFKGVAPLPASATPVERAKAVWAKVDFLSLMLALFGGTASLPHILIRYYTVKDQAAARKSTVVGIASIGFFYVLTLFLGLGAMTSGSMDVTNNNMAAPLLAKSFGPMLFAVISAIAFTTVLGTVSGLIMAASGAVAHDIMTNVMQMDLSDRGKVKAGKWVAVFVGAIAMVLGILFQKLNVTFLVGWAFNVAASANLPALIMLLFWRKTTKLGITLAIVVGLISSLGWLSVTKEAFEYVYGFSKAAAAAKALVPFSQPGIVTIPLGFITLAIASLVSQPSKEPALAEVVA